MAEDGGPQSCPHTDVPAPTAATAEETPAVAVKDTPAPVVEDAPAPTAEEQPMAAAEEPSVPDHRSYAGSFSKGKFHRTYKTSLKELSPEELKAVANDLKANSDVKAVEVAKQKKIHAVQKKRRKYEQEQKIKRIVEEEARFKEQRSKENAEKLKTWLADKEVVLKNTERENKRMLQEVAANRKAKADLKAANEAKYEAERQEKIRRHKEAQQRKAARMHNESQQRQAEADGRTIVVDDPTKPVIIKHHHLHHHVHYYCDTASGSRVKRSMDISHDQRPLAIPGGQIIGSHIDREDIEHESEVAVMNDHAGSKPRSLSAGGRAASQMGGRAVDSQTVSAMQSTVPSGGLASGSRPGSRMGQRPVRSQPSSMQSTMPMPGPPQADSELGEQNSHRHIHNHSVYVPQTQSAEWPDTLSDSGLPETVKAGWQELWEDSAAERSSAHRPPSAPCPARPSSGPARPSSGFGTPKALRGMGLPRQGCQDLAPLGRVSSYASQLDMLALTSIEKRIVRSESAGRTRAEDAPAPRKREPFGAPIVGPVFSKTVQFAQKTYNAVRTPLQGWA